MIFTTQLKYATNHVQCIMGITTIMLA